MTRVIYAGSFQPPTMGHLDIIHRAAETFDEVIVAVLSQSEKTYAISPEERADMIRRITKDLPNVRCVCDTGLLVDVARREGATVILRGIRGEADVSFELELAQANRLIGGYETVFFPASPEYSRLSSTIVRDCARHGAPLSGMVPPEIIADVYKAFG